MKSTFDHSNLECIRSSRHFKSANAWSWHVLMVLLLNLCSSNPWYILWPFSFLNLLKTVFDTGQSTTSCEVSFFQFSVFFSPLPHRWWFAVRALWLRCETYISTVQAGALLEIFFAWNVSQMFKELEAKQSVMLWRHTHFYINKFNKKLGIFN